MTGTIKWTWTDDQGKLHDHIIPKSYYVPSSDIRLLSPQHWMQHLPVKWRLNAHSQTYSDRITLSWGNFTRTIPLSDGNVATFYLAPGYKNFHAFCTEVTDKTTQAYDNVPLCISTTIPDITLDNDCELRKVPLVASFDFDQSKFQEESREGPSEVKREHSSAEAEFLHYHYKYGHVSPKKIREMARQGILPKRLASCRIPLCTACLYGKATKRPWRSKPEQNHTPPKRPSIPGQIISVDCLTSPTPGLIAQLTGAPTYKRYMHAAVYVDVASGYSFIWLQKSISEEETLDGKKAFERHCNISNVQVKHFHADNGIFTSNGWRQSCIDNGQSLTFAGVSAHHQNGIAEKRIRDLQEMARTMIIHAQRRWPEAITANLWPYALRIANDAVNASPNLQHKFKDSPEVLFHGSRIVGNPKHWHHFGCPIYVLARPLQTSASIYHKWKERSTLGIYLGRSPQHAKEVSLVLSLETGLVSPQYHVKI
jgi:hypothetical protein